MLLHKETNIAPNGAILDHFIKTKLDYREIKNADYKDEPYIKTYQRSLNEAERPTSPHLEGYAVNSFIVVDLVNGMIVKHHIQINHNSFHIWLYRQLTARNFMCNCLPYDARFLHEIKELLTHHCHLIVALKDYIDGGWLKTKKIKDIVEHYDNKREVPYSNFNYENVSKLSKHNVDEIVAMQKKKDAIRELKRAGVLNKDGTIADEYKDLIQHKHVVKEELK